MSDDKKIYLFHVRAGIFVHVRVIGRNKINGNGEYALIVPVAGKGSTWINAEELREVKNGNM